MKKFIIVAVSKVSWDDVGAYSSIEEAVYSAVNYYDRLAPVDKKGLEDLFIEEVEEVNGDYDIITEDGEVNEVVDFQTIEYGKGVKDAFYKFYDLEEAKNHYIDYINSLEEVDEEDKETFTEEVGNAKGFKDLVTAIDDLYNIYKGLIKEQLILELLYM